MIIVYKYTFPNGKIYIGVTRNSIQYRKNCGYQHNKCLQNAIKEYGWKNVKIDILEETSDIGNAFLLEEKYIKEFNSTDVNIGYNISKGGKSTFSGLKHTKEYKLKMSNLHKGKVFSEETLNRIKKSHEKERHPVVCLSISGKIICEYESLHSAAENIGGYPTNISRSCKNNRPYKGFIWKLKEDTNGTI